MNRVLLFIFLSVTFLFSSIENELGISVTTTSIYNEDGSEFKNFGVGGSYQINKYMVSPRFDLDYVNISQYEGINSLFRASLNGVYEIENRTKFLPYVLGGFGYEYVANSDEGNFESHMFVQGGMGVAYNFPSKYKAKLESRYLQILGGNDGEDNEAIISLGISMPIGDKKEKVPLPRPKPVIVKERVPVYIDRPVIVKEKVPVYIDRAPAPKNLPVYVNKNECSIKINRPDRDRDGVEDSRDQCPNTPCDFSVDGYGCPIKTTLRVNFSTNSSQIEYASLEKIHNFANFLLNHKGSVVKIVGHTDSRGSEATNQSLSQRRAKSVANKLIEFGVSASRISSEGKGESMPIASNMLKAGRRQNRRIEAILSYPNTKR